MESKKILLSSFDYPPRLGGVAKCSFALGKALNSMDGIEVRVCAPTSPTSHAGDYAYPPTDHPGLGLWRILREKRRAFKEWRPDHVLDMIWYPDGFASYLLSYFYPQISFSIIVHGVEILESQRTWKKKIRKRLSCIKRKVFQNAHAIFPVSRFTKDLVMNEVGQGNLQPFQNGVDPKAYFPTNSWDETVTFFTLSRLEDYKGIDMALRAMAILKKNGRSFQYRIAGTGPDLARLKQISNDLDLSKEVSFLGTISDEQALKEYQNCRAFVLLSRSDFQYPNVEGFGLVYLESALCQRPALGPTEGGPLDAIVDGVTGLLVDPRNETEIALALEKFFDDSFAKKLGKEAHNRALTFSWNSSAQLIVKGLQSCVG
jgi:glycosyltransferase involved in cell wall biosynthesis